MATAERMVGVSLGASACLVEGESFSVAEQIATNLLRGTQSGAFGLRVPHNLRRDSTNALAGWAYNQLVAAAGRSGQKTCACALGIHPSNMARRQAGAAEAPFARSLEEVWAFEADGHSTDAYLAALLAVQAQARGVASLTNEELQDAWRAANRREQRAEGAQNEAQTDLDDVEGICAATAAELACDLWVLALGRELRARRLTPRHGSRQ